MIKMYLRVILLSVLCGVIQGRWPVVQGLDSDLDSLLCQQKVYPSSIIDIHESIDRGAELLDGVWTKDVSSCMSECCRMKGCDLALFKNDGASRTGKNCYYVHCGTLQSCVMVPHSSFMAVSFLGMLVLLT